MPFKDPAVVKGTTAGFLQFMLYCKQQRSDWHGRRKRDGVNIIIVV